MSDEDLAYPLKVTNWPTLVQSISEVDLVTEPDRVSYVFRGQSCAEWPLVPSLTRLVRDAGLNSTRAIEVEQALLRDFQIHAHLHFTEPEMPRDPRDPIEWWSLMQHHGAPTRLLDWTASPYVALYFAVAGHPSRDGAVWLVQAHFVTTAIDAQAGLRGQKLFDPTAMNVVKVITPPRPTERMAAQQTQFSVSAQILANHGRAFADAIPSADRHKLFVKLIIPATLKAPFLRHLRTLNITARSLFPGVDGLGRSVAELAQLLASIPAVPGVEQS